jgi:primosomal protein N' (replication factor Y)
LFDYRAPAGCERDALRRGLRLRVPFGRATRIGFLWRVLDGSELPPEKLKPALALLDDEPLLSDLDLDLLAWAADYYQHPLGEVISAALPSRLRKPCSVDFRPERYSQRVWRLTEQGRAVSLDKLGKAKRQAMLLGVLRKHPQGLTQTALKAHCGDCATVLKRLAEKGWVHLCEDCAMSAQAIAPTLHAEQAQALQAVSAAFGRFQAFLLDGVTGSGKTEVYLQLIERVLETGGQVLILVPEIGLTPQLQRRLTSRIRAPIALLHSGLADGEREAAWRRARAGQARVVLGTRSAVFAPLPDLRLILVDEEHDLSLKQQDGFRYCARDVAVRRAQQRACPVLLGSATPSLETLRNAQAERYQWLRLHSRAGGAKSPRLDLIDLRNVQVQSGLSPVLIRLLRENLQAGGQSLLFLNRRGFAPVVTCHQCGWVAGCPACDARLTLHQATRLLWCHHCGYQHPMLDRCPGCGGLDLRLLGQGTERLEETLLRLFPDTPLARVDRDSTRRKGALQQLLEEAREGVYPLLLGTQILAKGHHFPAVTLVGVLDVDYGLYGVDFRAAERMAQMIVQVAGRAGRAEKPGRVAIQTRHPDHPLLQTLIHRGYGAFAEMALAEREQAQLPPFSAQALLRAESLQADAPQQFLEAARQAAAEPPDGLQFWGPAPAPMERRAGRYRAHLLIQSATRAQLQAYLKPWMSALYRLKQARQVRWSLDVDPREMI